jgi:hypothetical protein
LLLVVAFSFQLFFQSQSGWWDHIHVHVY